MKPGRLPRGTRWHVLAGATISGAGIAYSIGTGHYAWTAVVTVWALVLVHAVSRFRERIVLTAFLIAFAVFLLSAESLRVFLNYRNYESVSGPDNHLAKVLILALVCTALGHMARERLGRTTRNSGNSENISLNNRLRHIAIIGFWTTLPFALFSASQRALTVSNLGYAEAYVAGFSDSSTVLGQLEMLCFVFLCVFLASYPNRVPTLAACIGWALYLGLTLFSGQRSHAVLGALFFFCYFVIRSREPESRKWWGRREALGALFGIPILLNVLIAVETRRGIGGSYTADFFKNFADFFYYQGVSASTIQNAYLYERFIPKQNYLLEFAHSGIVARALGIEVISGNNFQRATEGASFTHALAYTILGQAYFDGRGTGSSFIAELYFMGGASLLIVGAFIMGALLKEIGRLEAASPLANALRLVILQDLLWAPRGSATAFLATLQAPSTVVGISVCFLCAKLIAQKNGHQRRRSFGSAGRAHRPV